MKNITSLAKDIAEGWSHLFFPSCCPGCGSDLLARDQLICLSCLNRLPATDFHLHPGNPVEEIFWGRIPIIAAACQYYFTKHSPLQRIMHQFKYRGKRKLGHYLGSIMGNSISRSGRFADIEAMIPLPLYAAREKQRGFNQAAVLCEGMKEILKVPVFPRAMIRLSDTSTQTHKSRMERWQNMAGRFQVSDQTSLEHKHLLLVDDVITTGATLEACAQELTKIKGTRVSITALAFASDL